MYKSYRYLVLATSSHNVPGVLTACKKTLPADDYDDRGVHDTLYGALRLRTSILYLTQKARLGETGSAIL